MAITDENAKFPTDWPPFVRACTEHELNTGRQLEAWICICYVRHMRATKQRERYDLQIEALDVLRARLATKLQQNSIDYSGLFGACHHNLDSSLYNEENRELVSIWREENP